MPSSRRSQSKGGSSNRSNARSSSQFPTPWSDWQWNSLWNNEYRYRQVASNGTDDDYHYEYRDPQTPRGQEINPTAVTESLATISETTVPLESQSSEPNYILDSGVQKVTEALSRTNLGAGGATQGQYRSQRQRSNSFGQGPTSGLGGNLTNVDRTVTQNTTVNLDPDFTIHKSWKFTFGQVFKVLWSEPTGSAGTELTGFRKARYGEPAYHSIRRFLIVDPRNGHCLCLPILTYGGRATLKKGVHAEDHAVIYTTKNGVMLQGEKITKRAIRMIPTSERHKLDPASRINYAKVYTVEHNVKVNFVGHVAPKYEQQVVTDYNNTHRPLPNRPYINETAEDTYEYAQGADPRYPPSSLPPLTGVAIAPPYDPISSGWTTGNTSTSAASYTSPPFSYLPTNTSSYSYESPEYGHPPKQTLETHPHPGYQAGAEEAAERPQTYELNYQGPSEETVEAAHQFDESLYDDN